MRKALPTVIAAFVMLLGPLYANAQTNSGTIRMMVGTPAGGVLDPYARFIADHMKATLGRTVIIENRPGANGNIAAQNVVDAPADGRTIWVGTQSMTEINPTVFSKLRWSMKDFVPLIKGVEAPLVLVVHPSVPANTLPELVDFIKKNPKLAHYASFSPGTPSHFLGHQLNETFGTALNHVSYPGAAPQTIDLVGGHVHIGFTQLGAAVPLIQAGKLKAIAVTSAQRTRYLPNTPTFAELGHNEFTMTIWFGLFIRTGTPEGIVKQYVKAIVAAHNDPEIKKKLQGLGFDVVAQTGSQIAADIERETKRWAKLVKATGFKAD